MKEFNYKKVVLILTVLLIIQIIIYAITNAVISKSTGVDKAPDTPVSSMEEREFLKKFDIAYADKNEEIINPADLEHNYDQLFKSVVSKVDFQKMLYKLVNDGFPAIYNAAKDKSKEEVESFYKTDYATINACGIMDEENYFYTGKELINQIYRGQNKFKSVVMDYDSITPNQNGYMTVNFEVKYDKGATIHMTAYLAEREGVSPTIKFRSNSDLKKLFEQYKGEVTANDFTDKLKAIAEYIPKITTKTHFKSNNDRKSYYKENIEEFKKIGIVSENDFMNLARAVSDETLVSDDFYNYEIRLDSVKEVDDRYEVKVDLVFMSGQEYNLLMKMYKAKNSDGRLIEFKTTKYDENYSDTNAE